MTTSTLLIPEKPVTDASLKTLWVLYYRQGQNPHSQAKYFELPNDMPLQQVVARAKRHCEIMNLRFTNIRPFLSDISKEEQGIQGPTGAVD